VNEVKKGALAKLVAAKKEWQKCCEKALKEDGVDIQQPAVIQAIGDTVVAAAKRECCAAATYQLIASVVMWCLGKPVFGCRFDCMPQSCRQVCVQVSNRVACFAAMFAEHQLRERTTLSPSAQYMQLIKAVQETRALADLLACFPSTDLALADDLLYQLQQIVDKLKQKLPNAESRWVKRHLLRSFVISSVQQMCRPATPAAAESGTAHALTCCVAS
jgi:hypothetical protein